MRETSNSMIGQQLLRNPNRAARRQAWNTFYPLGRDDVNANVYTMRGVPRTWFPDTDGYVRAPSE